MNLKDLFARPDKILNHTGGCGVCRRKLVDFVPPTLRATKMILVGEAPGATEVEKGEGFIGKSGQTIRAALQNVGIGIEQYSLTNTIHCRPPKNADPDPKEISCCMNEHVQQEISNYPLVVLVGNIAANAFFPGEAQTIRGNLAYHPDFPNSRFFHTLHPAAIGYDPKRKEEFYAQVGRLGRIYHGDTEAKIVSVTGQAFRERWGDFLYYSDLISLDLETNQLESYIPGGMIKSLAACSLNTEEVFAIDHTDPFFATALQLLKVYLQNPEKQVLGQNIGFDLVWLEALLNFKCNLKHIHDIQVLYYQLKQQKRTALKEVVAQQLDGYRHLVVWPHLEKDFHRLKLYNGEDVRYPLDLFVRDFPKLRPKTQDLLVRVLGPSALATSRMKHAGIHFRSEMWEALNKEFSDAREAAISAWEAEDPDFRRQSYITEKGFRDLDVYLYEIKKYPILKTTESSAKPSTDDSTNKELIRGGATQLRHCLTIKNVDKRRSTYILSFPKLLAPDRRIHASYHNTRTDTGRQSSSNPNMQNNPRIEDQWKNQIRWLFGAPPGSKFCSGDFSQIELRIAFSLANDPVGIEVYRVGGDLHIETAKFVLGDEPQNKKDWKKKGSKWEEARFKAKSANFALIYGGQPYTLQQYAANEFGIIMSDNDANAWHRGFFSRYPGLEPWHMKEIANLQLNKGYMESAVGHVWYYPDWDSKDQQVRSHTNRSAINMTCQGPAAYMMTYLEYLVQQAFWQNNILAPGLGYSEVVLTVHDSLAWEVAEEQAEESVGIVQRCLHDVVEPWVKDWFKVPLVLDTDISDYWDEPEPK